ncbi:hypothetical protein ACJIZ3_023288 [Penstemon smallii]|uniref:Dilute domain-containing protein n=1 Tax=Penstemon smallii TaxID=265156 RepID=A0ABD3TNP3_9LAMI
MASLPSEYGAFQISYNTSREKWSLEELSRMLIQEETRLKQQRAHSINMVTQGNVKHKKGAKKGNKPIRFVGSGLLSNGLYQLKLNGHSSTFLLTNFVDIRNFGLSDYGNSEVLSRCIKENLGFKDRKPIAACVIYRCLIHWHSFESEMTAIFDSIIENINDVLKKGDEDAFLPYWLSNASALLCLLQRNLRSNGFLNATSQRSGGSTGMNGRLVQGPRSSFKYHGLEDGLAHKEAKYPAILFKQQLTACVEKIFGLIRDNLKKEILPLLAQCIQAPKNQRVPGGKSSKSPTGVPYTIKFLDSLMGRLRGNYVPSFFNRKLTIQVFSFINIQLFNSLLLRRECCTFSNGEYVKSGLAELEKWIVNATEEFAGTSWHELNYIRQAVGFLVIHQKRKKSLDEIRRVYDHTKKEIFSNGMIPTEIKTVTISNEFITEYQQKQFWSHSRFINKDLPPSSISIIKSFPTYGSSSRSKIFRRWRFLRFDLGLYPNSHVFVRELIFLFMF